MKIFKDEPNSQNSISTNESLDLGSVDLLTEERSYRTEVGSEKMEVEGGAEVGIEGEIGFEESYRIEGDKRGNQIEIGRVKKKGIEERKEIEKEKDKEKEREKDREKARNMYVCAVMLRLWRAECRRILPNCVQNSSSSSSSSNNNNSSSSSSSGAAGVGDVYQVFGYSVSPRSLQGWESYVTEGAETINR